MLYSSLSYTIIINLIILLGYHRTNSDHILYDTLVIFGDSNSDNGNVYRLTNSKFPPSMYFQGRFSNSRVWAEYLTGFNVSNYAYGGATTDNNFIQGYVPLGPTGVPGVRQQIISYWQNINTNLTDFDRTLYVIWAGGNDYLHNRTASASSITRSLSNATKDLLMLGAKSIIIFNQPPLQALPLLRYSTAESILIDLTSQYNTNLSVYITKLQNEYEKSSIKLFDLNALISKVLDSGAPYGIVNTVDPCWSSQVVNSSNCSNPNSYVFFDNVHFTNRIHQLIADQFQIFIRSSSNRHGFTPIISLFYVAVIFFSFY
ncbi:unnamed protein product [Adineta steineri]|uniref:Uncharacterized protein n=1 Tax=Adineta steineri TaxID=433720 RepID=A0A815LSA7_9BILA|nr:unnamed protein product [Adineta steineri]CAF3891372.1 unnamed protein product [Adineta steineri]